MVERMTSALWKLVCFNPNCGFLSRTRITARKLRVVFPRLHFKTLTLTSCTADLLPRDIGTFVVETVESTLG